MTPRTLQIIALMQQAQDAQARATNLLLQELAEAMEPEQEENMEAPDDG